MARGLNGESWAHHSTLGILYLEEPAEGAASFSPLSVPAFWGRHQQPGALGSLPPGAEPWSRMLTGMRGLGPQAAARCKMQQEGSGEGFPASPLCPWLWLPLDFHELAWELSQGLP